MDNLEIMRRFFRTHLVAQPAVGTSVTRHQVSFVFECFGEVARATSRDGETNPDFTQASEVRRLGLYVAPVYVAPVYVTPGLIRLRAHATSRVIRPTTGT